MGGRPTIVGLIALAMFVLGAGTVSTPSTATAEFRIPGLFGGEKTVKRKRYRARRPVLPSRNPDRVVAAVSAETQSPKVAGNSQTAIVVGAASSASVAMALPAPKVKVAAAEAPDAAISPDAPHGDTSDDQADSDADGDATAADEASDIKSADTSAPADEHKDAAESTDAKDSASDEADADSAEPVETAETDNKAEAKSDAADETAAGASDSASKAADTRALDETEPSATETETAGSDTDATENAETEKARDAAPSSEETELTIAVAGATAAATAALASADSEAAADDEAKSSAAESGALPPSDEGNPEITGATSKSDDDEPAASVAAADVTAVTKENADSQSDEAASDDSKSDEDADVAGDASAPSIEIATDAEPAKAPEGAPPPPAHTATVVLEVSPPPGAEKADDEETKVAALSPFGAAPPSNADEAGGDAPSGDDATAEEAPEVEIGPPPPPPVHPVIASVRSKLDGSGAPKLNKDDADALKAFYGGHNDDPLWVSDEGLTTKAKHVIETIGDAADWGLDPSSYKLPDAGATLTTDEAKADAELAMSAAILKYARQAQAGRLTPSRVSELFDQHPKAREPKAVLADMAASETPDKTLLSYHPQHEQYQRLHTALVHARDSAKAVGRNPNNDRNVQLIVMNMERWRWMPRDLGNYYVWNNIPEFQFRVRKNGKTIYQEKSIVGQYKYATPFFSAPMRNIVFHPNWTVPPTIVKEDIAPKLRGPSRSGFFGSESKNRMLARYGLSASYKGEPVDADRVDWQNVNVHTYTFTQDPGPANVLGEFKFNFPNSHAIYMHDTPQRELFGRQTRTLSHGCIRVNQPANFAALLLGEDKGWSMRQVQDVLSQYRGQKMSKVIALNKRVPVHLTYFTAIADEYGSVRDYGDVYGIDNRMAPKMFANPAHFSVPASTEMSEFGNTTRVSQPQPQRRRSSRGLDDFLSGILGN